MAARALVLLVSFDARSSAAAGEAVFWDLDKGIQGLRLPDIEEELLLAGTAAFMPEELAAELRPEKPLQGRHCPAQVKSPALGADLSTCGASFMEQRDTEGRLLVADLPSACSEAIGFWCN